MPPAQIHNLVKSAFINNHVEGAACCLHLSPAKNAVFKNWVFLTQKNMCKAQQDIRTTFCVLLC